VFPFDATFVSSAVSPPLHTFPNTPQHWALLSNGYPGDLVITKHLQVAPLPTYYTGVLTDSPNSLPTTSGGFGSNENVTYVSPIGENYGRFISFYRPGAQQSYYGLIDLTLKNIYGHFTSWGRPYPFNAALGGPGEASAAGPGDYFPHQVLGTWAVLSNGWPGQLLFTSTPCCNVNGAVTVHATIWYDNDSLANTNAALNPSNEVLTNVKFNQIHFGWFLTFTRPGASQNYFAILSPDYTALHGHFLSGSSTVPYSFDATHL